jgi:hypothetical protein
MRSSIHSDFWELKSFKVKFPLLAKGQGQVIEAIIRRLKLGFVPSRAHL